jgi:hypothetical protein
MPRKTLRVRDISGHWVEIAPADVCPPPIQRKLLDEASLKRIGLVHTALKDVLVAPSNEPLSLEQFEIGFLRGESPEEELKLWEGVATALEKARGSYPPEKYDRKALYLRLLCLICGAATDQELRDDDSAILSRCFASSYQSPAPPQLNKAAITTNASQNGTVTICYVCYKRVNTAAAVFCPRCGRRLTARLSMLGRSPESRSDGDHDSF